MLLNISGVIGADNLSAVIIYGADFNFANKLYFGSRLMKRAEWLGVLSQKQHGGKSGHTSIKVVLLRILIFEYFIQTRRNDAIGSYDAEKFYDCEAHNLASLTDQDFDILFPVIIFCLKAIQEMKFYIKTVFG